MKSGTKRAIAASSSILVAAAVNVTTGELTQHWALAWWGATAALVVIGAGTQTWLTIAESRATLSANARTGAVNSATVVAYANQSVNITGDNQGIVSTGDQANNIQRRL